ncbi:MAG: ATP-dependent DNA helicase RecG [Gemmatimonadota bacterium]|nr:ATP-dependent DNA helicase RecG [Gemmatimonadota bacterium]
MGARSLLQGSVQYLRRVGPRRAERLERLNVRTGRDLLYHVPHRYEDATRVRAIASLKPGEDATVIGRVVTKGVLPTRRGLRIFRAVIRDASGLVECAWPGQPWLDRQIGRGDLLLVTGAVGFFHGVQVRPREHTVLAAEGEEGASGQVFPVYSATEGLGHRQIRAIVEENLDALLAEVAERDVVPDAWCESLHLPDLVTALHTLHRPSDLGAVERARRRLAFEEFLFLQLLHARARHEIRTGRPGIAMRTAAEDGRVRDLLAALPFRLTEAQRRAWEEIRADMEAPQRMYRLLQGDVGSGKTVVAALGMVRAVDCGRQAVLMAPTELLAEQHVRTLAALLAPVGLQPSLLTGSLPAGERDRVRRGLADGSLPLAVGTHALIQEGVAHARPGLVVIDEQHRFGVEQRRALREMGGVADTLVMSATPIPRSLALTLFGDLDLSVIDELPPGRTPVRTAIRPCASRPAALDWVEERLREGARAYFVYPLIDESETLDVRAAGEAHAELAERFPGHAVALLHGRLPAAEKEAVMRSFLAGDVQVLVATTVVEVGIDVAAARIMVIEHAERFGLSQLHQLRGRVGRGGEESWCIAFHGGEEPPARLRVFASTTDGFRLAEQDLRLRGQGDLFGPAQHGTPEFRFADPLRDADLLVAARRRARTIVDTDPDLSSREHRALGRELAERHGDREILFEIG